MSRISRTSSPVQPSLLKRLWLNSQTKILAYTQAITGSFLFAANEAHNIVTSSEVKDALAQITLPHWFPLILLGLAVATYVAHGHKDDA